MQPSDLTLAGDTIHNPGEPRHYMKLKPVESRVRVLRDGVVLAASERAVRLFELGRDFYDPVIYFKREDVKADLRQTERSTHCPLKGDAVYFDLVDGTGDHGGDVLQPEIAWSYAEPFDFAPGLKGLIAFFADKVTLEEAPK